MAARSEPRPSTPAASSAGWTQVGADRVSSLRARLGREGFLCGPPGRGGRERWARFSPEALEVVELDLGDGPAARVRLRARATLDTSPATIAELDGSGSWLDEWLAREPAEEAPAGGASPPARPEPGRRVAARRPRPVLVALSGLDGAGKSSQSAALLDVLGWLELETSVFWLALGHSPFQRTLRRLARPLRRGRRRAPSPAAGAGSRPVVTTPSRRASRLGTTVWPAVVGVTHALAYRRVVARARGRYAVVIFDRYVDDAAAQIRYFYAPARELRHARWLLRALAPRPTHAYLLDLEPTAALARKQDQYDLAQLTLQARLLRAEATGHGATVVDATSPREQITAHVARDVWSSLAA